MDWAFEGIGTLLVGLILGAGGGSVITWKITNRRSDRRQSQRAGRGTIQIQAGRDYKGRDIER